MYGNRMPLKDQREKRALMKKAAGALGYGIAVGFALYVRIFSNLEVLRDPRIAIQDLDSIRYLRLIELILHNYPSLPMFDSFANFPWGMKAQLPPIWAFVQATFGLLVNRTFGLPATSAAALFPVIFGLLLPIPTYFAGRYLFGKAAGHTAAITAMFLPVASGVSSLGMFDHHVADLVIYSTIIALLAGADHFQSRDMRLIGNALAILAGLAISLTLLISLSSILIAPILTAAFLLAILLLKKDDRARAFRIGCLSLGSAAALMFALYSATPWFARGFSFSRLSLLHPAVLLFAVAALGTIQIVDRAFNGRYRLPLGGIGNPEMRRVFALAALSAGALLAALSAPGIGEQIARGFYRSIGYYPLGRITKQLWPLFAEGTGEFTIRFSVLGYILPIGFVWPIGDAIAKRRTDVGRIIFFCWFAVAAAYYIASRYYAFLFAPPAFIALGFAVARLSNLIGASVDKASKAAGERRAAFAVWLGCSMALAFYLIAWTITSLSAPKPDANWIAMLTWIKDNTPKVSGLYDPSRAPEYGIATDWFFGEFVELVAERPTLSTANHETGLRGIIASHAIMQADSEEELIRLMERHRLRYIILRRPFPAWIGDIERIGEAGPRPEQIAYLPAYEPPEEAARLASVRLYAFWGGSDERAGVEPMQHLRLIKITGPADGRNYKLFELVKGARLIVEAAPGTVVEVETSVRAPNAPSIPWKIKRSVGEKGRAVFYLPYPTGGGRFQIAADPYRVKARGTGKTAEVSERDVRQGRSYRFVLE